MMTTTAHSEDPVASKPHEGLVVSQRSGGLVITRVRKERKDSKVGIAFGKNSDRHIIVTKVVPGGLLSASDIAPGQRVLEINGVSIMDCMMHSDALDIIKNADAGMVVICTTRVGEMAKLEFDFSRKNGVAPRILRQVPRMLWEHYGSTASPDKAYNDLKKFLDGIDDILKLWVQESSSCSPSTCLIKAVPAVLFMLLLPLGIICFLNPGGLHDKSVNADSEASAKRCLDRLNDACAQMNNFKTTKQLGLAYQIKSSDRVASNLERLHYAYIQVTTVGEK